jgi:ATP-dependent helicase/DNAse subunit B
MKKPYLPFSSYNLWSLFAAPVGQEHWHCDMKRGFRKIMYKEIPEVKAILDTDTIPQRVGLLAQQGVYEFHQNTDILNCSDGVEQIASILQLTQENLEVQTRVIQILENYYKDPILSNQTIFSLSRGDEGFPEPIKVDSGSITFNLFAAIDCIILEPDNTLHIIDFKTGQSEFDLRQAFVYLLAASYLYPQSKACASFYNLESCQCSEPITATKNQLNAVRIELMRLAQRHVKEKERYWNNNTEFEQIFPPNPGFRCQYCQFNSICQFSEQEVTV